jgi:hypothetical protein
MPKLKLERLCEGMKVAADIVDSEGMLLVPAGAIITPKHLALLNSWNIREIDVEAGGQTEAPLDAFATLSGDARDKLIAEIQAIFWDPAGKNLIQAAIFQTALQRRARRLSGSHS